MSKIKISQFAQIEVPDGTENVKTTNGFITLARQKDGNIEVYTGVFEDVVSKDLTDSSEWQVFTRNEIKRFAQMLYLI